MFWIVCFIGFFLLMDAFSPGKWFGFVCFIIFAVAAYTTTEKGPTFFMYDFLMGYELICVVGFFFWSIGSTADTISNVFRPKNTTINNYHEDHYHYDDNRSVHLHQKNDLYKFSKELE